MYVAGKAMPYAVMDTSRIVLLAAHPDDEVIGAGIRMTRWSPRQVTFVHLTDGSPRDPKFAQAAGFASYEGYARVRRRELDEALELAGMGEARCIQLGFTDQEAYLHLPELVEAVTQLVEEIRPDQIYTHPYEGGHPDHDAASFAAAFTHTNVLEFTSYHGGPQGLVTNEFLHPDLTTVETHLLSTTERTRKQQMFDCFRSQKPVLQDFPIVHEKFRPAPRYDFTKPPHPGPLQYERLGWNITGEDWRQRATEALQMLSVRALA